MSTPKRGVGGDAPFVIRGLKKRYGRTEVLHGLDLEVEAGSIHGLVGLNGSGKTTTLECALGLQPFNAGQVSVLEQSPHELFYIYGEVGVVFDEPCIPPNLSVRQVLQHARLYCGRDTRSPQELEALLGIERDSKVKVRKLSLGNRRRASIAQALIGRPKLVILDEPFSGLDAGGVDDVLRLIKTINQSEGTTFFLSSHQLAYLERICTHIAILHHGSLSQCGRVDELVLNRKPSLVIGTTQAAEARTLLSTMPDIELVEDTENMENKENRGTRVQVELRGVSSAELNRRLVAKGIDVSELHFERPSLDALFREITGGAA